MEPDPNIMIAVAGQQFGQYSQNMISNTGGWIDVNLRPYFGVTDEYVIKKLGVIAFPFATRRWSGLPDLYIPLMAFLTYVVAAGYMLGFKGKFSPEILALSSTSALVCLFLEVCLFTFLLNIFNVKTQFTILHHLAHCSYKFVHIIAALSISLVLGNRGYLGAIAFSSLALGYHLIKVYHVAVERSNEYFGASRQGIYVSVFLSLMQPFLMLWLSYHLIL